MDGDQITAGKRRAGRPRKARAPVPATPADAIDAAYLAQAPAAHRRAHAQVLTPPELSALMAAWIAEACPATLLDPAFGTGILARAVAALRPGIAVTGWEIDPAIAAAGRAACAAGGLVPDLRIGDFLASPAEPVEAVIANPPWLRPLAGNGLRAQIRAMALRTGLPLQGAVNAYTLFVIEACLRLRPGGRGAFLLPAEWANANSGAVLKDFLLSRGLLRRLVSVCNLRPVFVDALTTASLVLVEAPRAGEALPESIECLFVPEGAALPAPCTPGRPVPVAALCAAPKWDVLLRGLPEAPPPGYVRLGALAGTRRGLATGANGFFHLPRAAARAQGIAPHRWLPCVAKAGDAPGPIFTAADLEALEAAGRPTVFLDLTPPLAPTEAAYVATGAAQGFDARFLTRNRTPWHAPERLYVAPIWAATFARDRLRFVLNEAGALHLTAFHGIFPERRDCAYLRALTACLNAAPVARLAEAQLRRYGGGLRKIEPRDLLEISVPDLRRLPPARLAALGRALIALNEGRRGVQARLDRLVEEVAAEIATEPEEST